MKLFYNSILAYFHFLVLCAILLCARIFARGKVVDKKYILVLSPFSRVKEARKLVLKLQFYIPRGNLKISKISIWSTTENLQSELKRPLEWSREPFHGPVENLISSVMTYLNLVKNCKFLALNLRVNKLTKHLITKYLFSDKRCFFINENCLFSRAYGEHSKINWALLSPLERADILNKSKENFNLFSNRKFADYVAGKSLLAATGPSIDKYKEIDRDQYKVVICCNTIVANNDVLNHLRPEYITAGDAISHFGISRYAEEFRKCLYNYLIYNDACFVTSAAQGYTLLLKWPELSEKIMLIDQKSEVPVISLLHDWVLPKLDSTLNIHMFPIASTLSTEIHMLGFDGRSLVKNDREDFWNHSNLVHFHDLVDTGHLCHPSFDFHRQRSTEQRFITDTHESIKFLKAAGKEVISLNPSYTAAINKCYLEK